MEKTTIHIKNVVCGRCKTTVRDILTGLKIPFSEVSLGEAILERPLTDMETHDLQKEFNKVGFELLQKKQERIINSIKSIIIEQVYEEGLRNVNLSEILSARLNYDYSHLTNLFSKSEGHSIQSFQNSIKIERIKELLEYDELSISEIAADMGYSSSAYLSTSFRKATGISPSAYKTKHLNSRNSLDSV
ncbi:helix-turn-helix transcriptional regulator [Salegentibacter sp. F188]|uniref:Helix-turn-helix transcriptional regulator n=1 Tax=Autumnicola patrickiae TaxID=3075591 RepID=A0ABU3E0D7_9FLAO|nr:helix-turn-helix transcriptional regulator [Salegentibacter sp. F188]MDT0689417.1 helix-turn-helix transcriptional regulator [Salegentibacter sp. F188]